MLPSWSIEHAERFGLAQVASVAGTHRSRRAASNLPSLYDRKMLSDTAHARLQVMRNTNDGFAIAEEDWKLRGGGDVLGIRPSGLPGYVLADLLITNTC